MADIRHIEIEGHRYRIDESDPFLRRIVNLVGPLDRDGDGLLTEEEVRTGLTADPRVETAVEAELDQARRDRDRRMDDSNRRFVPAPVRDTADALGALLGDAERARRLTIAVPAGSFGAFPAERVREILAGQPPLALRSRSLGAYAEEEDGMRQFCQEHDSIEWCHLLNDRFSTMFSYLEAYTSREISPLLADRNPFDLFSVPAMVIPLDVGKTPPLQRGMPLATIAEEGAAASRALYLYADSEMKIDDIVGYMNTIRAVSITMRFAAPAAYAEKYADAFDEAAAILSRSHPNIHPNNLKLMLLYRLFRESFALDATDVWQDMAACRSTSCSTLERFEEKFPTVDAGWAEYTWLSASLLIGKQQQGFGPMQLILGLALEAASHEATCARYRGVLTEEELTTEEGALRALLDPRKAVFFAALIYDFILTRLQETTYRDPRVMAPSDAYPFPVSPKAARELALIESAQVLSAFPEEAPYAKERIISGASSSYWADFFFIGEILGIEPAFPELRMVTARYDFLSLFQPESDPRLRTIRSQPRVDIRFLAPTSRADADAAASAPSPIARP